ncbi:general stress protein [Paenibacillus lutrae]|uniref:General stress protein 17M-like domain-containing protein n=1 Tax=Paenibacillus lutrae TaxID=2078573 RepID=A0A7X3FHY6_9BACL|nr:general stress protein [Paenibacillus lutrae]MVO99823.1 hypothetical protein [Paenibacillus lutrae]
MSRKAIGVFHTGEEANRAIASLKEHGYTDEDISVLAKHKEEAGGTVTTGEEETKADKGAIGGAAIGSAAGLIAGIGLMAVPGIGPFLAAGPLAAALSGAALGAGAGGVTGALIGAGIPEDQIEDYHSRVNKGDILVAVETSEDKWELVNTILRSSRGEADNGTHDGRPDVYGGADHVPADTNRDLLGNKEDINFRR